MGEKITHEKLEERLCECERNNRDLRLELETFKQREKELIAKNTLFKDQLIRSEMLSNTGRLVMPIAHEINSPLQAIGFILETLQKGSLE